MIRSAYLLAVGGFLLLTWVPPAEADKVQINFEYRKAFQFKDMLDTAIAHLESVVVEEPHNAKVRFALATLYYQRDRTQEARQQLSATLKTQPQHAESVYHLGILFLEEGEVERFRDLMEETISIDPGYVPAYNSLAKAYIIGKRFEEANQILEAGKQVKPDEDSFYFNQALMIMVHYDDQRDLVIANLKRAVELAPIEQHFELLGYTYLEQKQYEAARGVLEKAVELDPKNVYALLGVASTYKEENEFEKALELAEQARQIEPANKDIEAEIKEYKDAYNKWKENQKRERR